MKRLHIIILVFVQFGLLMTACSQATQETPATIEQTPTKIPEPTSTSTPTPKPPTVTPIPPTVTPEPSPTPVNLVAMKEDFEALLTSGEQATEFISLSSDSTFTNNASQIIHVNNISDLLAYFENVEAEVSLHDCDQEGDILTCQATENNRWVQEHDLESLVYDEIVFSCDPEGKVEDISFSLSAKSGNMVAAWIDNHNSWLGDSDTAISQAIFTPEDQLIYSEESGQQIGELCETVQAHIDAFNNLALESEEKYAAGEYEEAILIYNEILTMTLPVENRYITLVNHADANDKLGNYQKAIESYLLAIEIGPDDPEILNNVCWDYGLTEQPEKALPYCEEAVLLDPSSAHMDSRGLVYGLLGDYEAAIADFEAVVSELENSTDPELSGIAAQRAEWISFMEAGENPFTPAEMAGLRGEVVPVAEQPPSPATEGEVSEEIQSTPVETDPFSLGMQYMTEGNFEAAIAAFTQAIEMEPQNPDRYQARAEAYFLTGQIDNMLADLNQSIAFGTQNGVVYLLRGTTLGMMGNTGQAISDIETALALGLPPELQGQAEALLAELKN